MRFSRQVHGVAEPDDPAVRFRNLAVSVLPTGATPLEKALLTAELAALADVDVERVATIWDPHNCPDRLLPWLAWALSVDVWDNEWPEATKRRVIAASPAVHRLKGTSGAVRRALDAVAVDAQLVEWWQSVPAGRRGTFLVRLMFDRAADYNDAMLVASIHQMIAATKPVSRVYGTKTWLRATAHAYTGCHARKHCRFVAGLPGPDPVLHRVHVLPGVSGAFGAAHRAGFEERN